MKETGGALMRRLLIGMRQTMKNCVVKRNIQKEDPGRWPTDVEGTHSRSWEYRQRS